MRPLAMACMMTTGLNPLIREAEPMSMLPPMMPASRMAVIMGCLPVFMLLAPGCR